MTSNISSHMASVPRWAVPHDYNNPLALFICEMIEYACAGCPNLGRIENEDGNISLDFKIRNTSLRIKEKKKKKGNWTIPIQKKLESLPLANCFAYIGKHMQNVFLQSTYQQKFNLCFSMAHKTQIKLPRKATTGQESARELIAAWNIWQPYIRMEFLTCMYTLKRLCSSLYSTTFPFPSEKHIFCFLFC